MNGVIINCSSRSNGNSSLLARFLSDQVGFENIALHKKNIKICTACRGCKTKLLERFCVLDDAFYDIALQMISADKIVFITPNYMGFISSLAKIFTDRFYCLNNFEKSSFKVGTKFYFLLLQGANDDERGVFAISWAARFFKNYGLDVDCMVLSNCKSSNKDDVKIYFDKVLEFIK